MKMLLMVVLQQGPNDDWNEVVTRVIEADNNRPEVSVKVEAGNIAIDAKKKSKIISVSACVLP